MAGQNEIYLIRTPVGERGGLVFGGPLRVRAAGTRAYAGFSSASLARRVCAHWSMSKNVFVEPWREAIEHDSADERPDSILFFDEWKTFEAYLTAPDAFPFDKHLIRLYPPSLKFQ